MLNRISAFMVMGLTATGMALASDNNTEPTEGTPISISQTNSTDAEILKKHRPEGANEIPTPKFVIKTSDRKFMMTIGGVVNPIMGVDIGNALYKLGGQGADFTTQAIPVPATAGNKSDFFIDPLHAAVDMEVVGLGGTDDQITAYIKFKTNGVSKAINLNRAYLTWRNFTIGMKSTLMEDDNACQPPTIDPEGPSGSLSTTTYEVSYKSQNYNGFRFALGIDMPTYSTSNGYYRGKDFPEYDGVKVVGGEAEQMIPDIPMWIQYGTSDYNRVRVSGLIRNFAYRDLLSHDSKHAMGWGVMLSGNLNPIEPLIIYFQGAYGEGIGHYIQDISGMPVSFIPESSKPGKMKASPMMGVNIGLTYKFSPKLQANIMASESRIWGVRDYCTAPDSTCNYKYALYAAANVFYNITPYLQCGIEYLWGRRQTWDIGGANDNRIQTQLSFSF